MTTTEHTDDIATIVRPHETKMVIDGQLVDASNGETFPVYDPATNKVLAHVPKGTTEDVDRAVASAQKTYESEEWQKMSANKRGRLLHGLAALVRRDHERLATIEMLQTGKTWSQAFGDVDDCAETLEFFAGFTTKIYGQSSAAFNQHLGYTLRESVGPCALIVPWNYPIGIAAWKIAPALAAGNTAIIKPASWTPLTAIELGKLAPEAGFPAGVLNVVTGPGAQIGLHLAKHPLIQRVSFTGETTTGRILMEAGAYNMQRLSLELGGKAPNIVMNAANLDEAVEGCVGAIFRNQGENCCAGARLFVQEGIYDEFMQRYLERTKQIKVGPGSDHSNEMGPIISKGHLEKVLGYVKKGIAEGATLLYGGEAPQELQANGGNWMLPTILINVQNSMCVAQEEIFGPVVTVQKFATEAEALQLANDTIYGLASAIWSNDTQQALRMSKKIKAGIVWVNTFNKVYCEMPFGGYKQSGIGRTLGPRAIEFFTEEKTVIFKAADQV
ncbi:MAG: aldehyde dehydrogenase family protein [Ktedonobacteraceae bacterium]